VIHEDRNEFIKLKIKVQKVPTVTEIFYLNARSFGHRPSTGVILTTYVYVRVHERESIPHRSNFCFSFKRILLCMSTYIVKFHWEVVLLQNSQTMYSALCYKYLKEHFSFSRSRHEGVCMESHINKNYISGLVDGKSL